MGSCLKPACTRRELHLGNDYVVEFLGYRFSFNIVDFEGRVVAAAVKLGVVETPELEEDEIADLVVLAAQGVIDEPASRLGRYLVRNWERVSLVEGESLVYWLRKLIFRGAWLDHQVKRGALEVVWDEEDAEFAYQHPGGGGRPLLELAPVPSWHELQFRPVAGAAYLAALLALDHFASYPEQLALGALTWVVLAAALMRVPLERRAQALGVVAFATIGEVTGSLIWGVYRYRLHNLPLFVPPAHGLVYLTGLSLAAALRAPHAYARRDGGGRRGALGPARADGAAAPRRRRGVGVPLLLLFLWRGRNRAIYAGVFLVVASLELYGTAIGTWRWARELPGLGIPDGNPPSGVASGYVWFDVMALLVAPYLVALTRRSGRATDEFRASAESL